jgi:hypothetical protein
MYAPFMARELAQDHNSPKHNYCLRNSSMALISFQFKRSCSLLLTPYNETSPRGARGGT